MTRENPPCWLPLSGIGYDVHAFTENRPLVLGGIQIPFHKGLDGHSDADVLCHAIADAILGAVGERDIGHHFPNTDNAYRGISSIDLLERVAAILAARGARLMNVDSTLIAEAPKVGPHVAKMRANISQALGISCERVGVKATTNERMGFVGREEGIAAFAVASVIMLEPAADPGSST